MEIDSSSAPSRGDVYVGKHPAAQISAEDLRRLSELNLGISGAHILMEWALLLGSIWLCQRYWNPLLYILTVFWIGGRQHAIAVLMHDGAHYLLTKNKRLNDWVCDLFLAWPVMLTADGYRENHWEHHRFVNSDKDPDCLRKVTPGNVKRWEFPTTWGGLLWSLLLELTGFSMIEIIKFTFVAANKRVSGPTSFSARLRKGMRWVFYGVILACAITMGFWKGLLLYWVIPFSTTFNLYMRIRAIAEHFATENDDPLNISRTTLPSWWEQFFIPKNVSYHLEHHLYPSVPFYRLPELHKILMKQPVFRQKAHVTVGYFGVMRECINLKGPKRTCLPLPQSTNV